ncbi:MAG: ATP-binding protein [Gemmatimonadaceae bacterium]|jgi:hypothetical protein
MARTSEFDPVIVDGALSKARLDELLGLKRESAKLDYKESYDPTDRGAKVRIAKHVLAMANTAGGYLVLGVRDDGTPVGLLAALLDRLDEADLRHQVGSYSSVPISLFFANRLEVDGKSFALIGVMPLTDRVAVAAVDGDFALNGRTVSQFRSGDVLVRHGSSSERWNQDDADWIAERIVRSKKDQWLRDFASDFRRLVELSGGNTKAQIDASTLKAPPEVFAKLVQSLLRSGDG